MRILLSNDDGYFAPGIAALARALSALGTVTVVAPERDRSGASNSLTLDRPLSIKKAASGFYYVNGTPTDCVHLAVTGFLAELPDVVVSGVNHGANMGDDTIYSGTVAAAMPRASCADTLRATPGFAGPCSARCRACCGCPWRQIPAPPGSSTRCSTAPTKRVRQIGRAHV